MEKNMETDTLLGKIYGLLEESLPPFLANQTYAWD